MNRNDPNEVYDEVLQQEAELMRIEYPKFPVRDLLAKVKNIDPGVDIVFYDNDNDVELEFDSTEWDDDGKLVFVLTQPEED